MSDNLIDSLISQTTLGNIATITGGWTFVEDAVGTVMGRADPTNAIE